MRKELSPISYHLTNVNDPSPNHGVYVEATNKTSELSKEVNKREQQCKTRSNHASLLGTEPLPVSGPQGSIVFLSIVPNYSNIVMVREEFLTRANRGRRS